MDEQEQKEIREEFRNVVNMAPRELEDWLQTEKSQSVGWGKGDGGESVGHQSGRRIVALKRKTQDEYDELYKEMAEIQNTSGQNTNIVRIYSGFSLEETPVRQ